MAYFETTKIKDSSENLVNPSSEEAIVLLRRMVKILENQAATDSAQRQRIVVETLPTLAAVTTVTGVTTVATVTSVTNIAALNGWNQQMFVDPARAAYNSGIRSQLTFS